MLFGLTKQERVALAIIVLLLALGVLGMAVL